MLSYEGGRGKVGPLPYRYHVKPPEIFQTAGSEAQSQKPLLTEESNMAVASVSIPGSTPGPTLGFDDYSLYSNLSDDELIQLAIERSLSDAHNAASRGEASNTPTALGRRTVQHRANPPPTRPNPPNPPRQEPSHRPPTANPTDARSKCEERRKCDDVVATHFVTGNGKRMLA
ncbi:unnamed protein product [Coregonus sp. 'balchen']|nr:unnamed protein product [Coregonus sp. 'balchen']